MQARGFTQKWRRWIIDDGPVTQIEIEIPRALLTHYKIFKTQTLIIVNASGRENPKQQSVRHKYSVHTATGGDNFIFSYE